MFLTSVFGYLFSFGGRVAIQCGFHIVPQHNPCIRGSLYLVN